MTVTNADLNSIEVKLEPLAAVAGEVLLDGKVPGAAQFKKWKWAPTLAKGFRNQEPAVTAISPDGHFSLNRLDEGDYSFFINNFWPEFYIKSILLDGKPIEGRRIHLSFGQMAHLIVNLATDGASGRLRSGPSTPPVDPYKDLCSCFGGPVTRRMLIPDPLPPDNSGIQEGFYNGVSQQSFQGVPPGRYRMVAMENLDFTGPFRGKLSRNHEFWLKLAALGQPVEIRPKEHFDLTAPIMTAGLQRLLAEMGVPVRLVGH